MQASFRHAHKPATCQESVAAAVSGHEAVHGHAHHAAAPAEGAETAAAAASPAPADDSLVLRPPVE